MRTLIVDLDDMVKTALIEDDAILFLHEQSFTLRVLDAIATMIKGFSPQKVKFITHDVITQCMYRSSCIAFEAGKYVGEINSADVQKLLELCDYCGLNSDTDVSFIDIAGYVASVGKPGVCYVERFQGTCRMMSVGDGDVMDYFVSSETAFEEALEKFTHNNNLKVVEYLEKLTDYDNLMCFDNASVILDAEQVAHWVSIFAYAYLGSQQYEYDGSVLQRAVTNILNSEFRDKTETEINSEEQVDDRFGVADEVRQVIPEEKYVESLENLDDNKQSHVKRHKGKEVKDSKRIPVSGKKAATKNEKANRGENSTMQKRARKSAGTSILLAIVLIAAVLVGVYAAYLFYLSQKEETAIIELQKDLDMNTAMIEAAQDALSNYNLCMDYMDNSVLVACTALGDEITSVDGSIKSIENALDGTEICVSVQGEENANSFVTVCQDAGYTANVLDDSGAAIAPDDAAEEETEGKDTKKRGSKEKDESESDDEERYIVRIIVI